METYKGSKLGKYLEALLNRSVGVTNEYLGDGQYNPRWPDIPLYLWPTTTRLKWAREGKISLHPEIPPQSIFDEYRIKIYAGVIFDSTSSLLLISLLTPFVGAIAKVCLNAAVHFAGDIIELNTG